MSKSNLILFLYKNGKSAREIADQLKVTPNLVYKTIGKYNLIEYRSNVKNAVYHTPEYVEFRKQVLERDSYKCTKCGREGTKANPLQVDHRKAKSTNINLLFELSNARTLCRSCHLKEPTTKTYRRLNKRK